MDKIENIKRLRDEIESAMSDLSDAELVNAVKILGVEVIVRDGQPVAATDKAVPEQSTKGKKVKDFDVWYAPCDYCGHDPGRSVKESVKRCWKCGRQVYRDFSARALKSNYFTPLKTHGTK